ncbi:MULTISPECIES: hypothetical protein [Flavobacterium]|uniref:Uncharacterized protein n=1 Tax=Flavobacterium jumunjinense TaxID=998845 RepID=A0ABV5GVW0_9FLAO|nr:MULTISPECIES: hypothetical protein [Flavobacterium]
MSSQVSNKVILNGREFELIKSTNEDLIKPEDFGIIPLYISSRCMRGYVAIYEVNTNSRLILKDLYVNTSMNDPIKFINGIPPAISSKTDIESKTTYKEYKKLNLEVPYSGYILIGDGFLNDLNTKFRNSAIYKEVLELEISNGKIKKIKNLSCKMAEYRLLFEQGDFEQEYVTIKIDSEIEKWFL